MKEIERKYLVTSKAFLSQAIKSKSMVQAYLSKDPERTVRVRIQGEEAYLTIKGKSDTSGLSRFEWEKEISLQEAKALLKLALPFPIVKMRYWVPFEEQLFEVDVFEGVHTGLVLAELELDNIAQKVTLPPWCGTEVTGKKEYYNAYLSETGDSNVQKNS